MRVSELEKNLYEFWVAFGKIVIFICRKTVNLERYEKDE
jgi:hypothetical protein